jgi:hypothetical protein
MRWGYVSHTSGRANHHYSLYVWYDIYNIHKYRWTHLHMHTLLITYDIYLMIHQRFVFAVSRNPQQHNIKPSNRDMKKTKINGPVVK